MRLYPYKWRHRGIYGLVRGIDPVNDSAAILIEIPALRLIAIVYRPNRNFPYWLRVLRDEIRSDGKDTTLAVTSGSIRMCFAIIREVVGNELARRIDEPITGTAPS